jgi:hypothetical protein
MLILIYSSNMPAVMLQVKPVLKPMVTFYTTKWNGAGFFKYDIDGTFLGAFQVGTVNGIRDLAYDGTYFYGGAAATTVYKMDFNTNTLIGQFTAPVAVRAIGYDEGKDSGQITGQPR